MANKRCPQYSAGRHNPLLGMLLKSGLALVFAFVLGLGFASPLLAADCTDTDGDGYVTCDGCTKPSGKDCGDCNEGVAAINPGASDVLNCIDDNCNGVADEGFSFDQVDNVDNDLDGDIDEGFGRCVYATTGPANECVTGGILVCQPGGLVCFNSQGAAAIIQYAVESLAGGNCEDGINNDCDTVAAAADGIDNDGDGVVDEVGELKELTDILDPACQEPEKCDNKDNDGDGVIDDGFDVGASCTAGLGVCLRNGVKVCTADGSGTVCSATAGTPKNEGTTYGASCGDGKDNDCDGSADLADSDCAGFGQPELCGNGVDDDGDGLTDEGFPSLGLPCAVGEGGCKSFGTYVCTADGTGTECGAVAKSPSTESVGAGTCADVIDNDCDGLVDAGDADCAAAYTDLGAYCSLPYVNGQPGSDCTGKSTIVYGSARGTVKAELLAYDSAGTLLAVLPNVKSGDQAHLASRIDPADWRWVSQKNKQGVTHTMFAPMPLLRVTATDGAIEDVAWCAIMPTLDLIKPDGVSISLNESSTIDVDAMLPLVDVDTLTIQMDGVDILADILADLGTTKAAALPTGDTALCTTPGSCVFTIPAGCGDAGTVDVEIQNLRIEGLDSTTAATAKIGVGTPNQVNTLSFQIVGLPPGGHIVYVNGAPLPLVNPISTACLVDDLTDTGTASAFGISVTAPTDQQVVATAPVQVQGKICGGNEIAAFSINGKNVDVTAPAHQTCTPGNGTTEAPECVVPFDEPIAQTDLAEAVAGTAPLGTFKRGTNRVIADASDVLGNRTFNTEVLFGLGNLQTETAGISQSLKGGAAQAINGAYKTLAATVTTNIDPAFVVGLEESAVQDFFNTKCAGAIDVFTNDVKARLEGDTFATIDAEPGCSCNLYDVPVKLEDLTFTPSSASPTCAVDFQSGQIGVTIHLPDMSIQVGAHDSCTDHGLFGECIARTKIDVTAVTKITDLAFSFTITENQIETKTPPDPTTQVFTWTVKDPDGNLLFTASGTCVAGDQIGKTCYGDNGCPNGGAGSCVGFVKNDDFDPVTQNDSGIECWGADVCSVFQFIGAIFIEIFTLGFADGFDIVGIIDFDFDFQEDFFSQLSASEPDPMSLDEIEPDPGQIKAPGTVEVTPGPIDVEIENGGLTVAFGGDFEVTLDPSQPETPPPTSTPATVPTVAQVIGSGDEISLLIADDVFNEIFYSMRRAGKLTSFCSNADALTVADLLPPDCSTLRGKENAALGTATAQGICYGLAGAACQTLAINTCKAGTNLNKVCVTDADCPGGGAGTCSNAPAINLALRGTCEGMKHSDCATLPVGEPFYCNLFNAINVSGDDSILTCGRLDAEPDLLFRNDDASDNTVNTDLLLNDLNIVFGLDRANDGYTGRLEDLKSCFSAEGNAATDCLVYSACLDLTLKTRMGIDNSTCSPTQTGFVFQLVDVITSGFAGGVLCAAAMPTDDPIVVDTGVDSDATTAISNASEAFAPAICVDGLTLGGVLNFTSADAKMFAITTTGATPGFADYLGLTGSLGVTP